MKYIGALKDVAVNDAPTRSRVAQTILERGPSTAVDLAELLGLTPAAVRRHLDQLVLDGFAFARDVRSFGRRGRGRPAKEFVLTDSGRQEYGQAYDDLAIEALRFVQKTVGDEALADFARQRLTPFENRYKEALAELPRHERAAALAEALTRDGFAASVTESPIGEQVCQHHCPIAHVAGEFPDLCEAETEMFARLLGTHVQRLATIAHGDGVCTTNLPHPTFLHASHEERVSP